jgi:hypothetical protein
MLLVIDGLLAWLEFAAPAIGLIRHSPDELWNGVDDSRRWGSPEAMGGLLLTKLFSDRVSRHPPRSSK